MNHGFRGRVVLVTGASSGIGRATAEAFARAGASVALAARNTERLEEIAAGLRPTESKVAAYHLDVTDRAEVFSVVERVVQELGRLDILINNAGIGHCLRLADLKPEEIERLIRTNLHGVIACMQAAIPVMKRQGGGQMVNISSTAGHKGIPMMSVYCATKFGVRGLTEAARLELKKDGIEVIGVSPGTTDTPFFATAYTGGKGWWLKSPWKATPDSVARSILRACARHKREIVLTPEGKTMVLINKFAPWFVEYMMSRIAVREA